MLIATPAQPEKRRGSFASPHENKVKLNKLKADRMSQRERKTSDNINTDVAFCCSFRQMLGLQARADQRAQDNVYIHSAHFLYNMLKSL